MEASDAPVRKEKNGGNDTMFKHAVENMHEAYLSIVHVEPKPQSANGKTSKAMGCRAVVILSTLQPHEMAARLGPTNVISIRQAFHEARDATGQFVWDMDRFKLTCANGTMSQLFPCSGLTSKVVMDGQGFEIMLTHFVKMLAVTIPGLDDQRFTVDQLVQLCNNPLPIHALATNHTKPEGTLLMHAGASVFHAHVNVLRDIFNIYDNAQCQFANDIRAMIDSLGFSPDELANGSVQEREQVLAIIDAMLQNTQSGGPDPTDPAFRLIASLAATSTGAAVQSLLEEGDNEVLQLLGEQYSDCRILDYALSTAYGNSAYIAMTQEKQLCDTLGSEIYAQYSKPFPDVVDAHGTACLDLALVEHGVTGQGHYILIDKHLELLNKIHARFAPTDPHSQDFQVWRTVVMPQFKANMASVLTYIGITPTSYVTHRTFTLKQDLFAFIKGKQQSEEITTCVSVFLQGWRTICTDMLQNNLFARRSLTQEDLNELIETLQPSQSQLALFPCAGMWRDLECQAINADCSSKFELDKLELAHAVLGDTLFLLTGTPEEDLMSWRQSHQIIGVIDTFILQDKLPPVAAYLDPEGHYPSRDPSVSGLDLLSGPPVPQPAAPPNQARLDAPPAPQQVEARSAPQQVEARPAPQQVEARPDAPPDEGRAPQPLDAGPAPQQVDHRPDAPPDEGPAPKRVKISEVRHIPKHLEGKRLLESQRNLEQYAGTAAIVTNNDIERWFQEAWFAEAHTDLFGDDTRYLRALHAQLINKMYIPRIDSNTGAFMPTTFDFAARTPGLLDEKNTDILELEARFAPNKANWQEVSAEELDTVQSMVRGMMQQFAEQLAKEDETTDDEQAEEGADAEAPDEPRPEDQTRKGGSHKRKAPTPKRPNPVAPAEKNAPKARQELNARPAPKARQEPEAGPAQEARPHTRAAQAAAQQAAAAKPPDHARGRRNRP